MKNPSFSIVVNTLNREQSLEDTLLSFRGLNYYDFEVIIVNGPSTDGSQAIVDRWSDRVKTPRCTEPNLSISRNVGIQAAAGDVVAFIDDDAAPHPDWLKELARHYADDRVGGVGGFTINNTGVCLQASKTICDRYGNAREVSPFFDERPLCFPGSPYYPSLLGTNSSFRRDILAEIGGFDHTFAYLLDETDVCLRVVDAGYRIVYAAEARVLHQYAASHIRSAKKIPKTLYPSVVSKSYFIHRHGGDCLLRMASELQAYEDELTRANAWLNEHDEITSSHRMSLDQDVSWGLERGRQAALDRHSQAHGDLNQDAAVEPFKRFEKPSGLVLALISQSFPPSGEAGIARWTLMMATALTKRGHSVHVITRAEDTPSMRFEDGFWVHRILPETAAGRIVSSELDLPESIAAWAAAVRRKVCDLETFGVQVLSAPIWDLEGAALTDLKGVGVVLSLHTSYALSVPFKPEWQARPLYKHFMIAKMIRAEKVAVETSPVILANSLSIIDDLQTVYDADFSDRVVLSMHGTYDPFEEKPQRALMRFAAPDFNVVFVGRFETRKGFDIAAGALAKLLEAVSEIRVTIVGDVLSTGSRKILQNMRAESLIRDPRVNFGGHVSREQLNDLFSTADIVIMPSRYESFGLVAVEAMAAGAAVVALSVGGLKEVVEHDVTGYLVSLDDQSVAECGRRLIELAENKPLAARFGQSGRERFLSHFTIDSMAEQAESAYRRALPKEDA